MTGSLNHGQDTCMLIGAFTISRKSPVSQLAQPIRFLTVFNNLIPISKLGNTCSGKLALIPDNLVIKIFGCLCFMLYF